MKYLEKPCACCLAWLAVTVAACPAWSESIPFKQGLFPQEFPLQHANAQGVWSEEINDLCCVHDNAVIAATDNGLSMLRDNAWQPVSAVPKQAVSRVFELGETIAAVSDGKLYILTSEEAAVEVELPTEAAFDACEVKNGLYLGTNKGLFFVAKEEPLEVQAVEELNKMLGGAKTVHQLAYNSSEERIVAATASGLFHKPKGQPWSRLEVKDEDGLRWDMASIPCVAFDGSFNLWFGCMAGVARSHGKEWRFFRGKDGLPYNSFTVARATRDGAVWFGTRIGAIRFDGKEWAYRQGTYWLPDDVVRDIEFDRDGNVWFATPRGVGRIEYRMMSLAEKAAYYEDEMERYIRRTEYGFVSEVRLGAPGDRSEITYMDSDNDGLWTSMYGAGECFAYGATKDPAAKELAKRVFEALRFLQKVTQGAEFSPPKGYVARTVRSTDDPDPNIGRIEADRVHLEKNDKLWKVYEPRWPKSADGRWYFKTDTSSDELDGHYFFYPLYFDLVADTPEEKERVREVVRDLTDHLIEHGFYLVDHDGKPTRWAAYGPASVNHDPFWFPERGLNSLSILSYLATAEYITGDAKYGDAIRELIDEHAYLQNLMFPKLQFGIGSGNQSDDEMAFMSFYNLIRYARDPRIRMSATYSFYLYWTLEQPEMNPFFNFAYAAVGMDATIEDPYGTSSVSPWEGWLDDAMVTLRGFPLDRCDWTHKNSHRIDIVPLPRQQGPDPFADWPQGRGLRVNGKVLPVENRHFGHWNTDPYALDYHGRGQELANGTVFLLPYYMGLYHGFIEESE